MSKNIKNHEKSKRKIQPEVHSHSRSNTSGQSSSQPSPGHPSSHGMHILMSGTSLLCTCVSIKYMVNIISIPAGDPSLSPISRLWGIWRSSKESSKIQFHQFHQFHHSGQAAKASAPKGDSLEFAGCTLALENPGDAAYEDQEPQNLMTHH